MRRLMIAALMCLAIPTVAHAQMEVEDTAYEDGSGTISAIVSKTPVTSTTRWHPVGDVARSAVNVDYDHDGVADKARLVSNKTQTGVEVVSGKTGQRSMAWLIDGADIPSEVYLKETDGGNIWIFYPNSNSILLYQQNGKPMASNISYEPSQTIFAISSKTPVKPDTQWNTAGDVARSSINIDYDQDGVMDKARLVSNGTQVGVEITSGKAGNRSMAWLIDATNLASDVYLEGSDSGYIHIFFPESTMIFLFQKDGRPMATYLND